MSMTKKELIALRQSKTAHIAHLSDVIRETEKELQNLCAQRQQCIETIEEINNHLAVTE